MFVLRNDYLKGRHPILFDDVNRTSSIIGSTFFIDYHPVSRERDCHEDF